jgi:hypothetical protein
VTHEKHKPRPGPSAYEAYFLERDDDDRTEWILLAEQDPVTGLLTWHRDYRAFNQTPLSAWKPPQR